MDRREETIAKVRALYDRAGTPGEKAAARAALERLGAPVCDSGDSVCLPSAEELADAFKSMSAALFGLGTNCAEAADAIQRIFRIYEEMGWIEHE